ncbi:MAG: hypothetical protein ACKPKO_51300, partial [Candidatus Fonsibacter sp.]
LGQTWDHTRLKYMFGKHVWTPVAAMYQHFNKQAYNQPSTMHIQQQKSSGQHMMIAADGLNARLLLQDYCMFQDY